MKKIIFTPDEKVRKKRPFTKEDDKYLTENYLLFPAAHMGVCLNRDEGTIRGRLKRLSLVRPPELIEFFKSTHRPVNTPSPVKKSYYTPKNKTPKEMSLKNKIVKAKPIKNNKNERNFKTKIVDYSAVKMVLVSEHPKTWKYVSK